MKNIFNVFKSKRSFFVFSLLLIIIDIWAAIHAYFGCLELIRFILFYLLIPLMIYFCVLKKYKSYTILLLYEFFISFCTYYELIGLSFFSYFWASDIWHLFNQLSFFAAKWFQPIIVAAPVFIVAFIVRLIKRKNQE